MSSGDLARRLGFLFALALFPIFLLAPAALGVAFASLVLHIPWWLAALAAAAWLIWRSATAWRLGAPSEPEARLSIPRQAGDPLWDLAIPVARRVGSPEPTAIELVAEPNAHVEVEDGGIVVRIGLPLLACCPADDIAAVITHELSHASLGHLASWRFEQRCMAALVRLASGTKVGFQRFALLLHLRLAQFVVLPDRRRDEAEADQLATTSTGADVFASALMRSRAVAQAWERGMALHFGIPRLAGVHASRLAGVRDLVAGAALAGDLDLSTDEGSWSTHPSTDRRLRLAGSGLSATALAPAPVSDLVLPWRELAAAELELDDSPSAQYPPASWELSWQPAITAALRDIVLDPAHAWSLPNATARDLIQRLVELPDESAAELGGSRPDEVLLAVAALAALQQGLVRFDWQDAAAALNLSNGLAAITATGRGPSGDHVLAPLGQGPATEFAHRLAAIGVDLDRALDLSRRPEEPAIVRAMFVACKLNSSRTTIALPDGLTDQQGWHAVLLNTGVALVPARPARTMDDFAKQIVETLHEVSALRWEPDRQTIWIPREAVSGVALGKRRSRVTITSASGAVSFTTGPADFDPEPFLGLWGRDRVSV